MLIQNLLNSFFVNQNKQGSSVFFAIRFIFLAITISNPLRTFSANDKSDTSQFVIVSKIKITGNEKTRPVVILRELTFKENDTIRVSHLSKLLKKSRDNLLKTPLFNFVTIDTLFHANKLEISIQVEERWYIWPYLIFEYADRNFSSWLQHKDLNRLNYGINLTVHNMRGLNENLEFDFIWGFNKTFTLSYLNLYLDKKRQHSLWTFVKYQQQNQIAYQTINNKQIFYNKEVTPVFKSSEAAIIYTFRKKLDIYHLFEFKYLIINIDDSIATLNPEFLGQRNNSASYYNLIYEFRIDKRDSRVYPLQGLYFAFEMFKSGTFSASFKEFDYLYLKSALKYYYKITDKLYFANSLICKKSTVQKQAYFLEKGLGFKELMQGYEYYVIDGQDFILNQNLIKFELLKFKILNLKFIPFRQFNKVHLSIYVNAFFNTGYVSDNFDRNARFNNYLVNTFLYSGGLGIDFVTYYDWMLRIDYSFNKLNENGLFVHFKIPF